MCPLSVWNICDSVIVHTELLLQTLMSAWIIRVWNEMKSASTVSTITLVSVSADTSETRMEHVLVSHLISFLPPTHSHVQLSCGYPRDPTSLHTLVQLSLLLSHQPPPCTFPAVPAAVIPTATHTHVHLSLMPPPIHFLMHMFSCPTSLYVYTVQLSLPHQPPLI